jgi:YD repeat-containing protein
VKVVAKSIVLAVAFFALVITLVPLVSHASLQNPPQPNWGTDGGDDSWTVTCTYDGAGKLVSRVCTSGGSTTCVC